MPLSVLICDDSSLARRQLVRALPEEWDVELSYAANGREALTAVNHGKADLMFLDLNMPGMSGYEVLETIQRGDLPSLVIVVSGDVQPEARRKVMRQGALEFLRKPVSSEQLRDVLQRYGLLRKYTRSEAKAAELSNQEIASQLPAPAFADALREVTNVAIGRAGSQLGQLLSTFVRLPVPIVHQCTYEQLPEHLHINAGDMELWGPSLQARRADADPPATSDPPTNRLSAVSHGFKAPGLAGEGIVLLRSADIPRLDGLMSQSLPEHNGTTRILTDLSELLLGACLKALSDQLDLELHHTYPVLLGHQQSTRELLRCADRPQTVLALEIRYELTSPDLNCYLLLLLTEDSISTIQQRLEALTA